MSAPFIWQSKELRTMGDIGNAMQRIYDLPDNGARQRTADEFMEAYRAISERADSNVGYWTGYTTPETMAGMLRLFGVQHPVFGGPDEAAQVTPEIAAAHGERLGQAILDKRGGST